MRSTLRGGKAKMRCYRRGGGLVSVVDVQSLLFH